MITVMTAWSHLLRAPMAAGLLAVVFAALPAHAQADDEDEWVPPNQAQPSEQSAPPKAPPQEQSAAAPSDAHFEDNDPRALTDWKPELEPYGTWVEDPAYGVVWVPRARAVGDNFAPYVSSGHWALTEDNQWIWVSDYPFGWVVFHYGRWVWTDTHGWAWIPGRRYAHAWVVWREPIGPYDYVGWAPAPPAFIWRSGVSVSLWYNPPIYYVFCPSGYVYSHHVHYYIVHDRHHVHRIAHYTRPYQPVYAYRSGARRYYAPAGPSPKRLRIPADATPAPRARPDSRALSAAAPATAGRTLSGAQTSQRLSGRKTSQGAVSSGQARTAGRATTLSGGTSVSRSAPAPVARPSVGARPGSASPRYDRRVFSRAATRTPPNTYSPPRTYASPRTTSPVQTSSPRYYQRGSHSVPRMNAAPRRR